jgi:two-component system, LytTR family, sensor kinase
MSMHWHHVHLVPQTYGNDAHAMDMMRIRSQHQRPSDRLLWSVLGVSAVVSVLTLVATRLLAPTPPPSGSGPMYPRMRMPPTATTGDLLRSMGIGSLTWYACVLSAPLFIWLARRLPIDRRRWPASVAVHVCVVVALVCVTAVLQHRLSYAGAPVAPPLRDFLRAALLTGMLPFITVAVAAQAIEGRTRAHDRELDAARVKGQLAEARLEALTAQLQPHFLFNTLQAISTLITRDPVAADRMLASLSDLLREVLRRKDRREVTLDEELRVLEPYLDISRWRFGERLSVHIDAADDVRHALVPFFVLQPLVENALHHGVGSRAGPGQIAIHAARENGRLWLTVVDDGPGSAPSDGQRGIGLPNTRARLQELYGERHALEIGPVASGGFRVRVGIPYHVRVDDAATP